MTMKKKEMAALFDGLGECALKTEVVPIGKKSGRVCQESMEFALVAMAMTFAFCAGVSADNTREPLGGMGEADRYKAIGCILQAAADMELKDAK